MYRHWIRKDTACTLSKLLKRYMFTHLLHKNVPNAAFQDNLNRFVKPSPHFNIPALSYSGKLSNTLSHLHNWRFAYQTLHSSLFFANLIKLPYTLFPRKSLALIFNKHVISQLLHFLSLLSMSNNHRIKTLHCVTKHRLSRLLRGRAKSFTNEGEGGGGVEGFLPTEMGLERTVGRP